MRWLFLTRHLNSSRNYIFSNFCLVVSSCSVGNVRVRLLINLEALFFGFRDYFSTDNLNLNIILLRSYQQLIENICERN